MNASELAIAEIHKIDSDIAEWEEEASRVAMKLADLRRHREELWAHLTQPERDLIHPPAPPFKPLQKISPPAAPAAREPEITETDR